MRCAPNRVTLLSTKEGTNRLRTFLSVLGHRITKRGELGAAQLR